MVDRLAFVVPSPGPDTIWSHLISNSPDPMLTAHPSALDEDFARLSLTLSFEVPRYWKDDFLVHSFDVADGAHVLDTDLHRMTGSSKPTTIEGPILAWPSWNRKFGIILSTSQLWTYQRITANSYQLRQIDHMHNQFWAALAEFTHLAPLH